MSNQTSLVVATQNLRESLRHPVMQKQLRDSLPPSVSLERFTAVTMSALNHNPDLVLADRPSFYNALVKAAQEGLLPDGNDAFLNVYRTKVGGEWIKKVSYQRMVGGVLKQFAKAGIDAYAESLYENDEFSQWNDGTGQHLMHRPVKPGRDRGPRIAAYAVGKLQSGRVVIQVMDMEQLGRAMAASKSKNEDGSPKGPWKEWPERMEQKSVLHRLRKRIAILDEQAASELNKIADDDQEDDAEGTPPDPAPSQEIPTQDTPRAPGLQGIVDQHAESDDAPREDDII